MSNTARKQPVRASQVEALRWMAVSHVNQKQLNCCTVDATDHTMNIPVYSEIHFLDTLGRVCLPFRPISLAS